MDFDKQWTLFGVETEISRCGVGYLIVAHNRIVDDLRFRLAEAEKERDTEASLADEVNADRTALLAENRRLRSGHCKDCCCGRSWEALGITEYTGRSIPEEIESLRAKLAAADGLLRCHMVEGAIARGFFQIGNIDPAERLKWCRRFMELAQKTDAHLAGKEAEVRQHAGGGDCAACGELRAEVERLRSVLRWTHETYCTEAWTSRGLHAPECLLYEIGEKGQ